MLVSLIPTSSTPLLAAGAGLSQVTSFADLPSKFKTALKPLQTYEDFLAEVKQSLESPSATGTNPKETAAGHLNDAWNIFENDDKLMAMGDPKRLDRNIRDLRRIHAHLLSYRAINEIQLDIAQSEDDQLFVSKIEEIFEQNQTKLREKLEAKIKKNREKLGYPTDPQDSAEPRDDLKRIIDGRSKPNKP